MIPASFFFESPAPRRDLPSFPTRRSSDLLHSGAGTDEMHSIDPGDFGHRPLPLHLQDRKSTRLNSSHVKTSYAVFCLKKKKEFGPHWASPQFLYKPIVRASPAHSTKV